MRFQLLLTLALAAATTGTVAAQSSYSPTFSARAAMEVTMPSGDNGVFKNGAGLTAGGMAKFDLPRNFFFEPGLLFSFSAMNNNNLINYDKELYEGSAKLYSLRVPINFGYTFAPQDNWMIDVYTGPWVNFNLSARQTFDPNLSLPVAVPSSTINLFKHGWKHVDAMWGFGLNFTFADHYRVGVEGGVAFTPLAKYGNKDKMLKIRRNSIAVSLGYTF